MSDACQIILTLILSLDASFAPLRYPERFYSANFSPFLRERISFFNRRAASEARRLNHALIVRVITGAAVLSGAPVIIKRKRNEPATKDTLARDGGYRERRGERRSELPRLILIKPRGPSFPDASTELPFPSLRSSPNVSIFFLSFPPPRSHYLSSFVLSLTSMKNEITLLDPGIETSEQELPRKSEALIDEVWRARSANRNLASH